MIAVDAMLVQLTARLHYSDSRRLKATVQTSVTAAD